MTSTAAETAELTGRIVRRRLGNPISLGIRAFRIGGEGRMTAPTACRRCGIEPLADARFCHGCGSPVGVQDSHAEYKQVTVLFADVVHSMDIAAAVGAERW
jgi:hypothetical protein